MGGYIYPGVFTNYDWKLIASTTPTSGTTVTFSSIPSYKHLRLSAHAIQMTATSNCFLRFNGDSGNHAYRCITLPAGPSNTAWSTSSILVLTGSSDIGVFDVIINNANVATTKTLDRLSWSNNIDVMQGLWANTAAITSISLSFSSSFSASNIQPILLYGSN